MGNNNFRPRFHLKSYSIELLNTLMSPLVVYFALLGNLFMISAMTLFYYFEHDINPNVNGILDVIWWGVTTVTTVGYGDIVPITDYGKMTGLVLMIIGVGFFVSFISILCALIILKVENKVEPWGKVLNQLHENSIRLKAIEKELKDRRTKS